MDIADAQYFQQQMEREFLFGLNDFVELVALHGADKVVEALPAGFRQKLKEAIKVAEGPLQDELCS